MVLSIRAQFIWSILLAGALYSCAQIRNPSGGSRDEAGPMIVKTIPENGSVRFSGTSIYMEFDEYVTLQGAREQVLISPPLKKAPDISLKGAKALIIDFKDVMLQENTTYTINLGTSIKDNNEGNVLEKNVFLFSTGDHIDSLMIAGQVSMARDDSPCSECSVLAFPEGQDSLLSGRRPNYVSRCDEDGRFTLANLSDGAYELIALKDSDKDLVIDQNEPFGFLREPIVAEQSMDTSLVIRVALRADTATELKRAEWSVDGRKLLITSRGPVDSLEIIWPEEGVPFFEEQTLRKDSTYFWFVPPITPDAEVIIIHETDDNDTIRVGRIVPSKLDWSLSSPLLDYSEDTLRFILDRPLLSIDTTGVKLFKDTIQVPYVMNTSKDPMTMEIYHPWEEGQRYTVTIDEGSIIDPYQSPVDSSYWPISVPSMTSLGLVTLDVRLDSGNYVLSLLNKDLIPTLRTKANGSFKWDLPPLKPGKYQVWIIKDLNGDGQWTRGHFESRRLPEPVFFQKEPITIRANWEMEMTLEPSFRE